MAHDTKEQLVGALQGSPCFGIQLDKTTDVAGITQLIVFAGGIFQDEIFEEILFCKYLKHRQKVKIFSSR